MRIFFERFAALFQKNRLDGELDRDIQEHIEMATEENLSRGMSPREAATAARRSFGGAEQMKEQVRDQRGIPAFETFFREARLAFRSLRRAPGFALLTILTLALGIGANSAIFSAVNALMLHPPGISQPGGIVVVRSRYERLKLHDLVTSYDDFTRVSAPSDVYASVAIGKRADFSYSSSGSGGGYPQRLSGMRVSWRWFDVFGAQPARGRVFTEQEDRPGYKQAVVLSDGAWRRVFGGDPAILGKKITLEGYGYEVIGVMKPGFNLVDEMGSRGTQDIFVPLGARDLPAQRYVETYLEVARLKPGVTMAQARAYMDVLTRRGFETDGQGRIREVNGWGLFVVPYTDFVSGDMKTRMLILWAAVGLVLLIACSNTACLMMARMSARSRELAVRTALGGTRWHLLRQLYAESLLLAAAGSVAGMGIAYLMIRAVEMWGPENVVAGLTIPFDLPLLAVTMALGIASTVLFGAAPALQLGRDHPAETLKDGARSATPGRPQMRLRSLLVTAEVTLALVLSIGAGLLLRSLSKLQDVNVGFQPAHLVSATVSLPEVHYKDPASVVGFYRTLLQNLSATPAVRSASLGYPAPFNVGFEGRAFQIAGRPSTPGEPSPQANTRLVTPGFFETLGIPLLSGRDFTGHDGPDKDRVTVIDSALARQYWPNEDPLGQRIMVNGQQLTIVGIVGHTKASDLASADEKGVFYTCYFQDPLAFGYVMVSGAGDPVILTNAIRDAVYRLDPNQPIYDARSMEDRIAMSLGGRRFTVVLLAAFAGIAVFLAALGLYGVINYDVTQRTQEIGIRTALGATRSQVFGLILSDGARIVLAGLALGWLAAFQIAREINGQLFGVTAFDPGTFALTAAVLAAVALLACYLPAKRAMNLDPLRACRYE